MENKIALVTGGNRGIGKEICRQLARNGFVVLLASRDQKKGEEAASEIEGEVHVLVLDVSDDNQVKRAAEYVEREFLRLDVLINNAGIGVGKPGLAHANRAEIKHIMETNFYGPIRMNGAFLPLLKKSNDPRIINMSSGMGALNDMVGGYAGYRLSKAGLNAQTILLANELKEFGIRVNAMCPGWVRTSMGGKNAVRSMVEGADTAVWLATHKDIPTGKFFRDRKTIEY